MELIVHHFRLYSANPPSVFSSGVGADADVPFSRGHVPLPHAQSGDITSSSLVVSSCISI